MQKRLEDFLLGLCERDRQICGRAPAWIVDEVARKVGSLLAQGLADDALRWSVDSFVLGATRFVADQSGSDCDSLLAALHSLTI